MTGLSCVMPAYNEAARIGAVLAALRDHPAIAEVIVVDDGSTDGTAERAEAQPGVTLLRQDRNGGKTAAVAAGIAAASGRHLLFLDADLQGLRPEHVSALAAPVIDGRADVAISLRGNAPGLWHRLGIDYISGERVVPRAMLDGRLHELRGLPRFGFEVWLNRIWIAQGVGVRVVPWPDVRSPLKTEKRGRWTGLRDDARMMRDIFRSVGTTQTVRQIAALRRQRV